MSASFRERPKVRGKCRGRLATSRGLEAIGKGGRAPGVPDAARFVAVPPTSRRPALRNRSPNRVSVDYASVIVLNEEARKMVKRLSASLPAGKVLPAPLERKERSDVRVVNGGYRP